AACASSRSAATRARSRSTPGGASARSARPRRVHPPRRARAAAGARRRISRRSPPKRPSRPNSPRPRPSRPPRARRRAADVADTLLAMEKTLILVKPDAFARGLSGEIIARFERKGLKIIAAKHMTVSEDLAKQHYAEHVERPFFGELVSFITSGPIMALVFEGDEAIKAARQVIGATNPLEATTGS